MSRTRDDFSQRTKSDLALRASYLCSLCKCSTVGPSDEGTGAVTVIGVAAHICAAAPGQGARRYDPEMSPEQRSNIDNGIWLCASCGVLVDRDEKRFTVNALRRVKEEHESSRRLGHHAQDEGDIVAIGPEIVALGRIVRSAPDGTRVRFSHFVSGSGRDLWSLSRDFGKWPSERRYALFNELGFGALLAEPPVIERVDRSYEVQFRLQDQVPRQDATAEVATMCRETGRMLRGLDAHIQSFEGILGLAQGTWFADLTSGSDFSDLYWRYRGSPWFEGLAKMEMIRLSSTPSARTSRDGPRTPFRIVNRVNRVEVPTFDLTDQRLEISVEFELEGMGPWRRALSIFVSTPEQLVEGRMRALSASRQISPAEGQHRE